MDKADFQVMSASTREDWEIIVPQVMEFNLKLPQRVLAHLQLLDGDYGGFPIDRLQHCLQTAQLAADDGKDDEYIVCALLHDIGDTLGSYNHADVGAAILQPFVSEANHWMVKHHAIFQGYNFFHHLGMNRNMRDEFLGHNHVAHTAEFVEKYDNPAFDSNRPKLSIEPFIPLVEKVFEKPRHSLYKKILENI